MKYRDPSTGQFNPLHVKVSDTLAIGFVLLYAGTNIPEGWLACDGSAVSRTAYSALFAAIGTTYGAGDGSTTFNLPDYRGRVGVGLDSNDTDFDTLGETLGEKTHTLTIDEMPSHSHGLYYRGSDVDYGNAKTSVIVDYDGRTHNTLTVGGGQSHNIIQPSIVTNYIIKAYQVVAAPAKVSDLFPVGKVEIFFDNEDHSNYLGFTWERVAQGRTLIGIDSTDSDFDTIGKFGGSKNLQDHHHEQFQMSTNSGQTWSNVDGLGKDGQNTAINYMAVSQSVSPYAETKYRVGSPDVATGNSGNLQPYVVVAYWRRVS